MYLLIILISLYWPFFIRSWSFIIVGKLKPGLLKGGIPMLILFTLIGICGVIFSFLLSLYLVKYVFKIENKFTQFISFILLGILTTICTTVLAAFIIWPAV